MCLRDFEFAFGNLLFWCCGFGLLACACCFWCLWVVGFWWFVLSVVGLGLAGVAGIRCAVGFGVGCLVWVLGGVFAEFACFRVCYFVRVCGCGACLLRI